MNGKIESEQQLVDELGNLPREIKPSRSLWPGIEQRLGSQESGGELVQRPAWQHRALAASIAIAFVAGVMFGRQMDPAGEAESGLPTGSLAFQAAMEATEKEYQAAFREFIPVGQSNNMLTAQAVQNIEHSWAELQQAETALLNALREFPENDYLNQKLLDLRAQQLGFMKQLASLDQHSRRKI